MKVSLKNLSLSRWTRIGLIAVGGVLVLWLGLMVMGTFMEPPRKMGEQKLDPNRCPHCNMALSKFAKEKGECLFCKGALSGAQRAALTESRNKTIAYVLIGLFVVLLVTNAVFFFRARARAQKGDEDLYYFRCHKCERKIRYRTSQVGQFARCPQCRQMVRFPPPAEEMKRPWWRIWQKRKQAV